MTDLHPHDDQIDRYLNGSLTPDEMTAFEIRLLEDATLFERLQLVEAMKHGLCKQREALEPAAPGAAQLLPFRQWLRQPLSMAASLLLAALLGPVLWAMLDTPVRPESVIGIGSVAILEQSRGVNTTSLSGPGPYLLQLDAGFGNSADSFNVTLRASGGTSPLLITEGLRADGDGWVRLLLNQQMQGAYDVELGWTDAAGTKQQRQFALVVE